MDIIRAGGLITIRDDRPELGFGELLAEAVDMVLMATWERLITKPVTLRLVDSLTPKWNEGQWHQRGRVGTVKRMYRSNGKPKAMRVQYTGIHEIAGHGSDTDVLTKAKRKGIMNLMDERPDGWRDIGDAEPDTMEAYWALPYESYANRMVEAATHGAIRSPFDDDYTREIADIHLPEMLAIAVAPVVVPDPEPAPEPGPEPPPTSELIECRLGLERYEAAALSAVQTLWFPAWGTPPGE